MYHQVNDGPVRLVDTRIRLGGTRLGRQGKLVVNTGDSTATDAEVTVTQISSPGQGFITAWDGHGSRPTSSVLNFQKGWTIANTTKVPVRNGRFTVYSSAGGDILIDLHGVERK